MEEYKVIKVKYNLFKQNAIASATEEVLNTWARKGWMFKQMVVSQNGVFVVLHKPKTM